MMMDENWASGEAGALGLHDHDSGTDENDVSSDDEMLIDHIPGTSNGSLYSGAVRGQQEAHRRRLPPRTESYGLTLTPPQSPALSVAVRTSSFRREREQPPPPHSLQPISGSPYHRRLPSPIGSHRHLAQSQISQWGRPQHRLLLPYRHGNYRRLVRVAQVSFVLCVIAYGILMRRGTLIIDKREKESRRSKLPHAIFDPFRTRFVTESPSLATTRALQFAHDETQKALAYANQRAADRRNRTRPPSASDHAAAHVAPNGFAFVDENRSWMPLSAHDAFIAATDGTDEQQPIPASVEQLCGQHARDAATHHPNSYLTRDALNSKSRVLITGILNPIGFHLAIALQVKCGVSVVMGVDPMFPNNVLHRLALQKRIQILGHAIPNLSQPIMLPYAGLDPRLNRKSSSAKQPLLLSSTEELNFLTFKPTHIIHLASADPAAYRDVESVKGGKHNVDSPYTTATRSPPLYQWRQSAVAMEHVLASISSTSREDIRPHLTYASSYHLYPEISDMQVLDGDDVFASTKLIDEVLANAYHTLHNVYSVGLRFSTVYGPWGSKGNPDYDMAEKAVRHWHDEGTIADGRDFADHSMLLSLAGLIGITTSELTSGGVVEKRVQKGRAEGVHDFIFVDDAVDSIIAAMQYRKEGSTPVTFNVASGHLTSLSSVAERMEQYMPLRTVRKHTIAMDKNSKGRAPISVDLAKTFLSWTPQTSLSVGVGKLLAWHLDKFLPFGPLIQLEHGPGQISAQETGTAFLHRKEADVCDANDQFCLRGKHTFLCSSECAEKNMCKPSIFDDVLDLTKELTEECEVVLYSSSLGTDTEDIKLQATVQPEDTDGDRIVCNVAFVPRDSKLVIRAVASVPESALAELEIGPRIDGKEPGSPPEGPELDRRIDELNGRLLHRGWVLVWVRGATKPLPPDERSLLKLSPGKLFASSVKYAMYVVEDFAATVNVEDVLFLTDEMHRHALHKRSILIKDSNGRKQKFNLAAEPERQCGILLAPMKMASSKGGSLKKLSPYEAVKGMMAENGFDPKQSEPKKLRQQREFYERLPTFVNRDDLRSDSGSLYRYEIQHWIRSKWIMHALKIEDARQLRCDWYEEHVIWDNDVDQFSFAHVMARRELERRIIREEPDYHEQLALDTERPELHQFTDSHEWHLLLRQKEGDKEDRKILEAVEKVPDHLIDPNEEEGEEDTATLEDSEADAVAEASDARVVDTTHQEVGVYVRIMSDRIMFASRKEWSDRRNRRLKRIPKPKPRKVVHRVE